MNQPNEGMRERLKNSFYYTDGDLCPEEADLESVAVFIQSEIDLALAKQREEIVGLLQRSRLPQNARSNGMSTLMYIPDEGTNIEINKRIDFIISTITKDTKD